MPKILRILITGSAFAFFFLGGGFLSWVVFPLLRIFRKSYPRWIKKIFSAACRNFVNYMRIMGLIGFNPPRLPENFNPSMSCVIIANHPSLIDVLLISTIIPNLTMVVKASWYRSKLIQPLLSFNESIASSGHLPQPDGPPDTVAHIVALLQQGKSVLIFPEGSRSPMHGLRRFRRGACEAAIQAGVPILPILIKVDPPTLLKNQAWYEVPPRRGNFTFEYLPIILTQGRNLNAKNLNQELYQLYRDRLGLST